MSNHVQTFTGSILGFKVKCSWWMYDMDQVTQVGDLGNRGDVKKKNLLHSDSVSILCFHNI